jgi:hypothetical protein
MESLAYLVLIIFAVTLFAGPLAIVLALKVLVNFLNSKVGLPWAIVKVLRRILHGCAVIVDLFLGITLLFSGVTAAQLLSVYALLMAYIALDLEYFAENSNFRGKVVPPVYSADGTEIIRDKKVKRLGRSSGRDGHGPGGQH